MVPIPNGSIIIYDTRRLPYKLNPAAVDLISSPIYAVTDKLSITKSESSASQESCECELSNEVVYTRHATQLSYCKFVPLVWCNNCLHDACLNFWQQRKMEFVRFSMITVVALALLTLVDISVSKFLYKSPTSYKTVNFYDDYKELPKGSENNISLPENDKLVKSNGSSIGTKVLSCYYNVPNFHDSPFPVFPEQIDPFLCTHINVAFARVENCNLVPANDRDIEFYNRTIKLKLKNPALKVMISVGGAGAEGFDFMMASKDTRRLFIQKSISFMNSYGFDGLDIDWEFPVVNTEHNDTNIRNRNPKQKHQFSKFLTEFKSYVNLMTKQYILTAAVGARKTTIDFSYDIPSIAQSIDFINLMTYDFHYYSRLTSFTGPNSPLHSLSTEIGYLATMNAAWAAKYWYQNGMPANKLVLGLPTYGRTFRLVDERYHGYYSVASGVGSVGSNGYISYPEVCKFLNNNGTSVVFNLESREPYAYNERDWTTFPDIQSTKEKVQFVNEMNFLGVTVYNMNSDDAWKMCDSSKTIFPIIQTVKDTLNGLVH